MLGKQKKKGKSKADICPNCTNFKYCLEAINEKVQKTCIETGFRFFIKVANK